MKWDTIIQILKLPPDLLNHKNYIPGIISKRYQERLGMPIALELKAGSAITKTFHLEKESCGYIRNNIQAQTETLVSDFFCWFVTYINASGMSTHILMQRKTNC